MKSTPVFEDGENRCPDGDQSGLDSPFLDELGAVTIPRPLVLETGDLGQGSAPLQWLGSGTELHVAGYTIKDPCVYHSEGIPAVPEASCINGELEVGAPGLDDCPPLGHWPCYALLSPRQRADYLSWLADGRERPLSDPGYAFMFLYGLERYTLIDGGDPEAAIREVLNLLDACGHSGSFFACASRFIGYLFALEGIVRLRQEWFERLFLAPHTRLHRDVLAVALTWLYERGMALPGALAFEAARQDIRCATEASAQGGEAFRSEFLDRYHAAFPEGMGLQARAEPRTWWYRPASPSFQDWQMLSRLQPVTAPDVLGMAGQFTPLVAIWKECAAEHFPGRSLDSRWDALVESHMDDSGRVVVPVSDVGGLCDMAFSGETSLSLQQSLRLVDTARIAGFGLLPPPRVLMRPYRADETVALIRPIATAGSETEECFLAGALLLELGLAMAMVDGRVERLEVLHVSEIVHAIVNFSEDDRQRLRLLRHRFVGRPPNLVRLCHRLRAVLTESEMAAVAAFLVTVAASNYEIEPSERRALRQVYRSFGIGVEKLASLLAELESDGDHPDSDSVKVCPVVLARMMTEAGNAALGIGAALGAMVVREATSPAEGTSHFERAAAEKDEPCEEHSQDAEQRYRAELYALLSKGNWDETDVMRLAERHGLFPSGIDDNRLADTDEEASQDRLIGDPGCRGCLQRIALDGE